MAQKANNTLDIILIYRFITQTQALCCLLSSQPTLCRKKHNFLATEEKLKLRLKDTKGILRDDKASCNSDMAETNSNAEFIMSKDSNCRIFQRMRLSMALVVESQNEDNWNKKWSSQRQIKGQGVGSIKAARGGNRRFKLLSLSKFRGYYKIMKYRS